MQKLIVLYLCQKNYVKNLQENYAVKKFENDLFGRNLALHKFDKISRKQNLTRKNLN